MTNVLQVEECCDHLYVYDGSFTNATLLADLRGEEIPESIVSSSNALTLQFVSGILVELEGFSLSFHDGS